MCNAMNVNLCNIKQIDILILQIYWLEILKIYDIRERNFMCIESATSTLVSQIFCEFQVMISVLCRPTD